jgi:uncharacterized glyoxalase superfamily protein PhnB
MSKKKGKTPQKSRSTTKKSATRKLSTAHGLHRMKAAVEKPGWMGIEGMHLAFTTKEPHAVANFYRDILGFVDSGPLRPKGTLKPGYSHRDEPRGVLQLQSTRDSTVGFQDYHLAYHWVTQLGGRPPEEPLSAQIYFLVRDVDRLYERLNKKGVQFFDAPREMPWGHRVIECADPEGRRVVFAEVIKKKH